MAMTLTPEHDYEEVPTSGRRRKITKFALAGVAVLGVGGALTSAAWSDNVFFSGSSSTATFELSGYDEVNNVWVEADSKGLAITLPSDALDNVGPDISDSYTLTVKNDGSVPLDLTSAPVATTTGQLFRGNDPAVVTFGPYSRTTLAPTQTATVDVIVTGDADWDANDYLGKVGTVTVQITGQS